jgi:hypothetical protein
VRGAGDDVSIPPYGPASGSPHGSAPVVPGGSSDPYQRPTSRAPLALGALIVCAAAFLLGWVPLLGAALGIVGLVLVILAAKRGLATRRTYAGAAAAALGVLASAAATIALVGVVLLPGDEDVPDPVVAEVEHEELGEEEGAAGELEPLGVAAPDEEDTPTPAEESEPTEEPSPTEAPVPTEAPDLESYEELDERTLAQIVKAPDDHIGRQVIVHGRITQLDAATGKCFVRVSIAHAPQDDWYEYEHNSVGFAGDGESDCPVLDPFVADDEVTLWVTIGGSLSYDTQIGGSTTVPAYLIDDAELIEG